MLSHGNCCYLGRRAGRCGQGGTDVRQVQAAKTEKGDIRRRIQRQTDEKEDRERDPGIESKREGETLKILDNKGYKDEHRHPRQMTQEQATSHGSTKSRIEIYVRNMANTKQIDSEVVIPSGVDTRNW